MSHLSLEQFEKLLGYVFKDKQLLQAALTHSSTGIDYNYERLEFLGDRVLGLVIAELLYDKFPQESEGDLAKRLSALVQGSLLAKISDSLNLGDYIQFSDAERGAGGAENDHILADVFEATLGALYLDSDLDHCRQWIVRNWDENFFIMKEPPQHPKTALQEWAQAQGFPLPEYKITGQTGPDHAPMFQISLLVKGKSEILAEGRSRQEAEKQAAKLFLEKHT